MANAKAKAASKRKSTKSASEPAAPALGRGERRKLNTRRKLLGAALKLMSERGVDGVAINEITEAADVGFGSFYNHFESKEAIYDALVDAVVVNFGEALDTLSDTVTDPAEILSASLRYGMQRVQENPVWGRFLLRASMTPAGFQRGIGQRLLRDLMRGMQEKRFDWSDNLTAVIAMGGTGMAALGAAIELADKPDTVGALFKALGLEADNLPSRVAAAMLKMLGLDESEALEIAQRPLPAVELPDEPWFAVG